MNLFLKRIVHHMKLPLFIFILVVSVYSLLYWSSNLVVIDEFGYIFSNFIIPVSVIITSIVTSIISFVYLVSQSREKFLMQGGVNRTFKFFAPLLSLIIFIGMVDLIFYLINAFTQIDVSHGNMAIDYIKKYEYIIIIYIFFIYNVSIDKKMAIINGCATIVLSYSLFPYINNVIVSIMIIIILLIFNYIIYYIKTYKHDYVLVKYINNAFIISLICLAANNWFFSKVYYINNPLIAFGEDVIGIGVIILLVIILLFSWQQTRSFFNKRIFLIMYIIPLLISFSVYYVYEKTNFHNDDVLMEIMDYDDGDNLMYMYINDELPFNLNIGEEQTEKIKENFVFSNLNRERIHELDYNYLNEHNLIFLKFMSNGNKYYGLIKEQKFLNILEESGYRKVGLAYTLNQQSYGDYHKEYVIIKDNNASKQMYKDYLRAMEGDESSYNAIESNALYEELGKLPFKRINNMFEDGNYLQKINAFIDKDSNYVGEYIEISKLNDKEYKIYLEKARKIDMERNGGQ